MATAYMIRMQDKGNWAISTPTSIKWSPCNNISIVQKPMHSIIIIIIINLLYYYYYYSIIIIIIISDIINNINY